jgi:hypothetical protein
LAGDNKTVCNGRELLDRDYNLLLEDVIARKVGSIV